MRYARGSGQQGQAEVEDLDGAVCGDGDVCGLDVAMDDAARVRLGEPMSDLCRDLDGFFDRHRPARDPLAERLPVTVGHGDERPTVFGLTDLVDRADVGVIQSRRCSGFSQEASLGSFFPAKIGRQKLEGDKAVQPQVSGLVDHPHAALADSFEDLEMRDRLADHPGVTVSF
ncbi:MAG: hypothetical protein WEB59_16690 [Thermoanaerobaculia bacterium]